jgi:hypothetical protein
MRIFQLYQFILIFYFNHLQNWVRMPLNNSWFGNSCVSALIWRRSCCHQVTILFSID